MKRRWIACGVLIALVCSIGFAYEPTVEFERSWPAMERAIEQWLTSTREGEVERIALTYWPDAVKVTIYPDGARDAVEGREAIRRGEEAFRASLDPELRNELRAFSLPEPRFAPLPETDLPVVIFESPGHLDAFQFTVRAGLARIQRHLFVLYTTPPFEAGEYQRRLADGNGDGLIDGGEQLLLAEWYQRLCDRSHRVQTLLDADFDWDQNGVVDQNETERARSILVRDQLRFGRDSVPEFLASFVNLDSDPFISVFEAQDLIAVAQGHMGHLPQPTDPFLERFDFDLNGWVTGYELEILSRLLAGAVIRIPDEPRYWRASRGETIDIFVFADVDGNRRLSEPELFDVGLFARQLLTTTEVVTNPIEARFDSNRDFLLSRTERERALEMILDDMLPEILAHADLELGRWRLLRRLDRDSDGTLDGDELEIVWQGVLSPGSLSGREPSSVVERAMDVDPPNNRLEEHEVLAFVDGVFAALVQTWIESYPGFTGRVVESSSDEYDRTEAYGSPSSGNLTDREAVPVDEPEPTISTDPPVPGGGDSDRDGLTADVTLLPVFPVLYEYHAEAPIGTVAVVNTGNTTLRNVSAKLRTAQYMDFPLSGDTIPRLEPGTRATLELRALFTSEILTITEGTRIAAEITVTYESDLGGGERVTGEVLQIFDRNAVRWDDDRKVAAYVTSLSPAFLTLAGSTAQVAETNRLRSVSRSFQEAMALFDAMLARGIAYRIDPSSSYSVLSESAQVVDYVRYPYQTWSGGYGDCDDLSVLYATLLEAAGIPSAFVTVPGHILVAFQLDITASGARAQFSNPLDLIFDDDGTVWVPVETTKHDAGFVGAWRYAAGLYREHAQRGTAALIPTASAWQVYSSVQSPFEEQALQPVTSSSLESLFAEDLDEFVDLEIADREVLWTQQLADESLSTEEELRVRNRLGWLFAYYDRAADARVQFEAILANEEFAPALVNLGNLAYLDGDYEEAAGYYDRALAVEADSVAALLGAARAHYELQNFGNVRTHYAALQAASPSLAATYGYLDMRVTSTARAQAARGLEWQVVWEVEADDSE